MNQNEFEALCLELRDELKTRKNRLSTARAEADRRFELEKRELLGKREKVIRNFRDDLHDIALMHKPKSGAYIAAVADARNRRDDELEKIDSLIDRAKDAYYNAKEEIRRQAFEMTHDYAERKADALRAYGAWLEERRARKEAGHEDA